jgi:hypothetical protein
MKQLLIFAGPQGSGNHLWSKIASHTPGVEGWSQLTQEYFVNHRHEPFNEIWNNPSVFSEIDWPGQYYMTSRSCPMGGFGPGSDLSPPPKIPKYDEFISEARKVGFEVKLAVIGRDQNILACQQQRLRTWVSTPRFLKELDDVLMKYDPVFVSTELLYLYKNNYVKQVSKLLNFPLSVDPAILDDILRDDQNKKYVHPVESHWLDDVHKETQKNPRNQSFPAHIERKK